MSKVCSREKTLNPITNYCIDIDGVTYNRLIEQGKVVPLADGSLVLAGKGMQRQAVAQCPDGWVPSPESGYCIKIDGPSYRVLAGKPARPRASSRVDAKKCDPGWVTSPESGRCIKVGGPTHRVLAGKPARPRASSRVDAKKCDPGWFSSPESGRCIKIDGPAHRALAGKPAKQRVSPRVDAKKCDPGWVTSPESGRCIKVGGPTHRVLAGKPARPRASSRVDAKKCEPGWFSSPESGRCIKIDGPAHRALAGKPAKQRVSPRAGAKKCEPGWVTSPESGYCVKIDSPTYLGLVDRKKIVPTEGESRHKECPLGRLKSGWCVCPTGVKRDRLGVCMNKLGDEGKAIIAKPGKSVVKPVGPGIDPDFSKITENCVELNKWITKQKCGEGAYGAVYIACPANDVKNCEYVLKIQVADHSFMTEVKALQSLAKVSKPQIVPKLYSAWTCEGNGYMVIEKLTKCNKITKYSFQELGALLTAAKRRGWLHVDIHKGNIMCNSQGRMLLIDWGGSAQKIKGKNDSDPVYYSPIICNMNLQMCSDYKQGRAGWPGTVIGTQPWKNCRKLIESPVSWNLLMASQRDNYLHMNPSSVVTVADKRANEAWIKEYTAYLVNLRKLDGST